MNRIIQLPGTLFTIWHNLNTQQKFLSKHIGPVINEVQQSNDGSLKDEDFQKINGYYGWAVPAVIAEAICYLHGKPFTAKERWASTCQGAMTGIFDDFFDKDYLSGNEIANKLSHDNRDDKSSKEKLFDYFYREALNNVPDKKVMAERLQQVHIAQIESLSQKEKISIERLKEITRIKGGYSLLFYRTAIDIKLTEAESNVLFETGALMQLCNDIFDIYKDREDQIHTLATVCTITGLEEYFNTCLFEFREKLAVLPVKIKGKNKFLNMVSIAVFNRAMVCLEQFKAIEKREGKFNSHQLSRKDLICDMDTWKNKLRSAVYFIKM